MATVKLQPNESQEQLLKRFRKKVVKSGILSTVRRKRWFISKSELRRIQKKKAIRRIKRRPGVGHDGDTFADERRDAEISTEARQRRRGHVLSADEPGEYAADCALARAFRADDQRELLLICFAANEIAE